MIYDLFQIIIIGKRDCITDSALELSEELQ